MTKLLTITMLLVAGSIKSAVSPLRLLVGAAKTVTARAAQQRLISRSARLQNDPSKAELENVQLEEQFKQLMDLHKRTMKIHEKSFEELEKIREHIEKPTFSESVRGTII